MTRERSTQEQIIDEAFLALEVHAAIRYHDDVESGLALLASQDHRDRARSLLRRYPTPEEARAALDAAFWAAAKSVKLRALAAAMDGAETTADRRRLAREIEELRSVDLCPRGR